MQRNRTLVLVAVAAAVLAVAAGAAIATTQAPAQERDAEHRAFLSDVADRLGVTTEQLEEALRGASRARVDRLLADGAITEAQAERLRSRIDAGAPLAGGPGPWFGGPGHSPGRHHRGGPGLAPAADYLGLTRAELREALRAGSSLAALARERGKSLEGLKQALLAPARARLDAAEQAGRITAQQKQQKLRRLTERVDRLVQREGGPGLRGFGFGRRGG